MSAESVVYVKKIKAEIVALVFMRMLNIWKVLLVIVCDEIINCTDSVSISATNTISTNIGNNISTNVMSTVSTNFHVK